MILENIQGYLSRLSVAAVAMAVVDDDVAAAVGGGGGFVFTFKHPSRYLYSTQCWASGTDAFRDHRLTTQKGYKDSETNFSFGAKTTSSRKCLR